MGNRKKKDKKKALKHRFAQKGPPTENPSARPRMILEPSGDVKMSQVLIDFLEPYEDLWETTEQLEKLLTVALVAWNASVFQEKGAELVTRTMATLPPDAREGFLQIVALLMERKVRFFADNRRLILSYDLTHLPDGSPHLSVASTLLP